MPLTQKFLVFVIAWVLLNGCSAFIATPLFQSRLAAQQHMRSPRVACSIMRQIDAPLRKISPQELEEAESVLLANHNAETAAIANALFVRSEGEQEPVRFSGALDLPPDLPGGALMRIGPNPRPNDPCPGFLDGDGMIHSIVIPPFEQRESNQDLWYSRAWVRAAGFAKEEKAGQILFVGMMCAPQGWPVLKSLANNLIRAGQPVKDTVNTALSCHGGQRYIVDNPPSRESCAFFFSSPHSAHEVRCHNLVQASFWPGWSKLCQPRWRSRGGAHSALCAPPPTWAAPSPSSPSRAEFCRLTHGEPRYAHARTCSYAYTHTADMERVEGGLGRSLQGDGTRR